MKAPMPPRESLCLGEHEIASQVPDIVDEAVGAAIGGEMLEDVIGLGALLAVPGRERARDAGFQAFPFAPQHVVGIDPAAQLPAVAVGLLRRLQPRHIARRHRVEEGKIAAAAVGGIGAPFQQA
jgi:hypothetical protein